VNVYACVIIIKIAMHCSIHNKTSKIVKMNFFEFLPKICKKAGKILTPRMSRDDHKTVRREKLCLSRVDARVFRYSM